MDQSEKREPEIVDPVEQLAMSLHWEEEYSDEYKRRVLSEAIAFVYRQVSAKELVF